MSKPWDFSSCRVIDDDDSNEDGADDGEDSDSDKSDVEVDFSFMDPRPIDFKSVRRLLEHYLPGEEATFPASACADDVIAQRVVGTMVKVPGDGYDDAYAFATVLPWARVAAKPWAQALRAFVAKRGGGGSGPGGALLASAFADPAALGLMLSERVFNMPPEVAPALIESLALDFAWARKEAPAAERAAFERVKQLIMIAPCWAERVEGAPPASAADGGAVPPGFVPHFLRFEEALFAQHATAAFAIPVAPAGEAEAGGVGAAASESAAASAAAPPIPPASGSRGGKKSKRADDDGGGDGAVSRAPLRTPLLRRILLFPVTALEHVARTAAQNLAATKADVLRGQAAAQKSGGAAGVGAERAKQLPPAPASRKSAKRAP